MSVEIPAFTVQWWGVALVLLYLATGLAMAAAMTVAGSVFGEPGGVGAVVGITLLWLPLLILVLVLLAGQLALGWWKARR